jgi:hypothetical protein
MPPPPLTAQQVEQVLEQMRSRGKRWYDPWSEYDEGTSIGYGWIADREVFQVTRIDVVVGSFFTEEDVSPDEVRRVLRERANLYDLGKQGFEVSEAPPEA